MQFFCKNKLFTLSGKNSIFDFWMGSKYASVDGSYQCLYEWGIIIVKTPCYDFLSGVGHSSFSFYQHSFKKIRQYCFLCNLLCWVYYYLEAVDQTCSVKKVSLEISQNSQENTCARVSNLIKLQAWSLTPGRLLFDTTSLRTSMFSQYHKNIFKLSSNI